MNCSLNRFVQLLLKRLGIKGSRENKKESMCGRRERKETLCRKGQRKETEIVRWCLRKKRREKGIFVFLRAKIIV